MRVAQFMAWLLSLWRVISALGYTKRPIRLGCCNNDIGSALVGLIVSAIRGLRTRNNRLTIGNKYCRWCCQCVFNSPLVEFRGVPLILYPVTNMISQITAPAGVSDQSPVAWPCFQTTLPQCYVSYYRLALLRALC